MRPLIWSENTPDKYFYFPYAILEWNKLDKNIQQSKTIKPLRSCLLKTGWPTPKPVYNTHNPTGLSYLMG